MLRRPQLRAAVGHTLLGSEQADGVDLLHNLASIGFIELNGDAHRINESFLDDAVDALDDELGPLSVLRGGVISVGDLKHNEVDSAVAAVANRVLRSGERITEAAFNERLRMFVTDYAFFRRHAVDTGVVEREPDGSHYWLSHPAGQ